MPIPTGKRGKLRVATVSLSGCFGCHMSLLDIDERIFDLIEQIELDRSPLTDIKNTHTCDLGLIEGAVCNEENVHVLEELRANCKVLVGVGACAVMGGFPAQRNGIRVDQVLTRVYRQPDGSRAIPDDAELPRLLDKVYPVNEIVRIDYFLPGCPPPADAFWKFLTDLLTGRTPRIEHPLLKFD
jgi:NAD-reducing hydrogenase small subunit